MDKSAAIAVLGALAQDTRLEIFRHLAQTGPQPAGQVGERFGLPLATLSFHLHALKQVGLLGCHREGRQLIYQAQCDVVAELMNYLTEHCCVIPSLQVHCPTAVSHGVHTPETLVAMHSKPIRKPESHE